MRQILKKKNIYPPTKFWRSGLISRVRQIALFDTHVRCLERNRTLENIRETFDYLQVFLFSGLQGGLQPRVQKVVEKNNIYQKKIIWRSSLSSRVRQILKKKNIYQKKIILRSSLSSRVRETALFETHARYLERNRTLGTLRETFDYIQVFLFSSLRGRLQPRVEKLLEKKNIY